MVRGFQSALAVKPELQGFSQLKFELFLSDCRAPQGFSYMEVELESFSLYRVVVVLEVAMHMRVAPKYINKGGSASQPITNKLTRPKFCIYAHALSSFTARKC